MQRLDCCNTALGGSRDVWPSASATPALAPPPPEQLKYRASSRFMSTYESTLSRWTKSSSLISRHFSANTIGCTDGRLTNECTSSSFATCSDDQSRQLTISQSHIDTAANSFTPIFFWLGDVRQFFGDINAPKMPKLTSRGLEL